MAVGEPDTSPEVLWGIQRTLHVEGAAKTFALVAGLAYVVGGVIGFFYTGFRNFAEPPAHVLFGILPVTPYHNVVHVGVGGLWLLAALVLTRPAAQGVNLAIGGVYALAAVLGYLGYLAILGISAGVTADSLLHIATAAVTLVFAGLIPSRKATRTEADAERP